MIYRKAEIALDRRPVVAALQQLEKYAAAYPWVGTVDFDKGSMAVLSTIDAGNAYMVGGYLVLVDEIVPWYTNDKLLQEWLVIKVRPSPVQVSEIPGALILIAKARGCVGVITADSSPVQLVAKAYANAGFSPLTTSFYKVLPNGIPKASGS